VLRYVDKKFLREGVFSFCIIFIAIFLSGCLCLKKDKDCLYQYSVINALMEGVYDGEISCGSLKKQGDFGIGTFNRLDGEMIGIDGSFYQVKYDGTVCPIGDETLVPFAVVKFFKAEKKLCLMKDEIDYEGLLKCIDSLLPSGNTFFAVRIDGKFSYVKARSVPSQSKPYPRLTEAVKKQSIFEFKNVKGSLVGFRFPEYMQGVNVPGYHFHFISEDRMSGGHLLDCRLEEVVVKIDRVDRSYLVLPDNKDFLSEDLTKGTREELLRAEKKK